MERIRRLSPEWNGNFELDPLAKTGALEFHDTKLSRIVWSSGGVDPLSGVT
jgi:hypothetical protein